jgi:type IV fimbrial biogenesis protein FimT
LLIKAQVRMKQADGGFKYELDILVAGLRGFSLIELMIVLVILTTLAAITVPSFKGLLISTNVTAQANDFAGMITFARSEAIKRNFRVTLCRSSNGVSCNGTNWEQGYLVFTDAFGTGGATIGQVDPGDTVLFAYSALAHGSTLRIASNPDFISFSQNGRSSLVAGAQWTLCPKETDKLGRHISVSPLGVVTVTENPTLPCG